MSYQYIELTENSPKRKVPIKPDKKFFKLIGVYAEGYKHRVDHLVNTEGRIALSSGENGRSVTEYSSFSNGSIDDSGIRSFLHLNCRYSNSVGSYVEVGIEDFDLTGLTLTIICDIDDLHIPISNPFKLFEAHMKEEKNSKILFSAPFGHGKTTFLKQFFNPSNSKYEVFHIFPVNFSVASNEDIFRYIKTELLFQLLGKDVEFDKLEVGTLRTVTRFLGKNAHNVMAPFIKLVPGVGRSLHDIYKRLFELSQICFEEIEEDKVGDKDLAMGFIQELYEKEGSIYEDNFYTQLIRQLIEQLKTQGKKVVWVIDDLDRLDPEHMFRILNVLSAHVDDYNSEILGLSNKFGFDTTILVADYYNLISIFKHKYGASTDSGGYFDKFFSKNIFYYNNTDAVQSLIDEYTYHGDKAVNSSTSFYRLLLRIFLKTNNLSLRELLQLRSIGNSQLKRTFGDLDVYLPIYMLCDCFTINDIELKLKNARVKFEEKSDYDFYYDYHVWQVLIYLSDTFDKEGQKYHKVSFKDQEYIFRTESQMRNLHVNPSSIFKNEEKPENPNDLFGGKDFTDAVILLFEKYKSNQVAIENEFRRYYN